MATRVRVNFMTGTPWENGIHAVAGFVSVIQYHSEQTEDGYTRPSKELWKSIPSLAKATGKRALRYGQDMEAAMKAIKTVKTSMKKKHSQDELNKLETQRKSAEESFDQTMNDFREVILALVIRRDAETHWFNGEIMLKLPRKEKFDMHCSLPGATVDAINKFAETYRGEGDAGDEAALAKGRWLQICATLPGLLNRSLCTTIANEAFNRATRKDKLQANVLLWTREYANECHLDDLEDPNNPIVKYSSQIVGAGVKIDAITELARQHLGPRDKILIFDFSPITAMVVTAELRRRLKADRVSFYGGKMKQVDKDKLRKKFQTEVDPHILVTSHRQLAVGVDLNAAKTVVHMGPTTDVKALLQGESRVWRFDGETDTDYTVRVYTLYDRKLDIESELLAGRSLREQFASQVGKADGEGASDDDYDEEE